MERTRTLQAELNAIGKRLPELDKLIQPAYEDKVLGRIPESVCVNLLNRYEAERREKQERRKELTKLVRKGAEESKVAIRSIRRDAMEQFKKLEKDGLITEDDRAKAEKKMQEATDAAIKGIDELSAKKEKEIMEV